MGNRGEDAGTRLDAAARPDGGALPGDGGASRDAAPDVDGGPAPLDAGPSTPDAGPPPGDLVPDLRVDAVAAFQTVRIPLVEAGAPVVTASRNAPLIAGRDTLFRVYPTPEAGWRARPGRAVIELDGARFTAEGTPALPLADTAAGTPLDVRVPGSAITAEASFRVRLEEVDGSGVASGPAAWPASGAAALDARDAGVMEVVLVPFRYDTDGSGRLPATDAAQLALYARELTTRFPYAEVDIRVHAIVPWSRGTRFNGNVDWGDVNAELIDLRDAEGAPEHEYWYGVMAPHESRSSYCASTFGTCVTGQSYVSTLRGTRVGSGVGFAGEASAGTLAHELGHQHGRYHSPCGTSGTDADYPYASGVIGVWGWDPASGAFYAPDTGTDIMGYCDEQWVSDYTYAAFFQRAVDLRGAYALRAPAPLAGPVRFLHLGPGEHRWSAPRELRRLPGAPRPALWLDARGRPLGVVEAGYLEEAHGGGRVWVLPAEAPFPAVSVQVGDAVIPLGPR